MLLLKLPKRKTTFLHHYVSGGQTSFFCFMFLLVRLVHSIYYWTIFNILTSQKEDVNELKFLWLVNTTDNSTKFILIFEDVTCII